MKINDLASKLNKRIDIEKNTNTPDGFGGYNTEWEKLKSVWAEIIPIEQIQQIEGNRIEDKITHLIKIRFIKNIKTSYRLKYKERIFFIKSILNINEDYNVLELKVEEF